MEISEEIYNILSNLKEKHATLKETIDNKIKEKEHLENDLFLIQNKIQQLDNDINHSSDKLKEIYNTIDETEKGYNKIISAGETLKQVINQNVSNLNL